MKINIFIDKDNVIQNIQTNPLIDNMPTIDIESLEDIHIGYDQFINNQIIHNDKEYNLAKESMKCADEIYDLKQYLNQTDYVSIKYVDGAITEQEYQEVKTKRQKARDRINELEKIITKNRS